MAKSEFNLKEYIVNSGDIKKIYIPKLRYFLMYLKEISGEEALFDADIFEMLNQRDLLDSLEFYIDRASPARNTAQDYRRAVMDLCESVCRNYGISNELLENVGKREAFIQTANERIDQLEESKNRQCLSDEEFEQIDTTIDELFELDNLDKSIADSIDTEKVKWPCYGNIVSAIAFRLVSLYALGNNDIANLKLSDLQLPQRILRVNGIDLPIREELAAKFRIYLSFRELVIRKNHVVSDYLLLKQNGFPCISRNARGRDQADNNALGSLMKSVVGHIKMGGIQYRAISDLVAKGVNVNLLRQLTGTKEETIGIICRENMDDYESDLQRVLKSGKALYTRPKKGHIVKGLMRCPFCGKERDACSDNWLLIQNAGEEKKHLACRECEGLDGEYHY